MKRTTLCLALVLLLTGCASMKNTPIQDYVLEMGRQCENVSAGWRIDRVDTAGHYWIRGEGPAGPVLFRDCMKEQYAKRPFNEWLKETRGKSGPGPTAGLESAGPSPVPIVSGSAAAVSLATEWRPGYQWSYRYESPRERGTFAWIVNREELVDGTPFYVIGTGTREIYFRKADGAIYIEKVNGAVEVRNNPPIRMASATPGEKWEVRYVRERPQQQATESFLRTCESTGPEAITVPAGTFETVKTRCVDGRTGEPVYEIWYSFAMKQMVKDRTQFAYGWRERELIGHRLYPDRSR